MTQREFAGLVVGICISGWAHAQVTVDEPWIRATAPGQTVAGGYMKLKSAKPSALVEVSTPLTARAEIHEMSMEAGVMKMRAVPKVDLPAGKTVEFKPGGYHLMLMNLARPLRDGETVPITLVFEGPDRKRERIEVNARVRDVRAGIHGDMKHGH
jgi:copper(I)-binding protein